MSKKPEGALLPIFAEAEGGDAPLFRQIYRRLRDAVLSGALAPGARLPSTRTLAQELGVSRNTVVAAIEELAAEGYVEARVGAGTFVASALPEELLSAGRNAGRPAAAHPAGPAAPRAVARGAVPDMLPPVVPFRHGVPAYDVFPFALWRRLQARRWRTIGAAELHYGPAAGWGPLRRVLAAYLRTARGVRCEPDQVVVLSSTQAAFDMLARLLLLPGDRFWMEEPGYGGARKAFARAGGMVVPVPVDAEGLDVAAGRATAPDARVAYVTPSCQYPLNVTLSLPRRLALLAWAREAGAWIVEDDYDSEYRYAGRPLAALQGLDVPGAERVIYLGTFSKVLFPGLRLAYAVLPPELVEPLVVLRRTVDDFSPLPAQMVLHDFLDEGHFAAHLRRTRLLYAERQDALLDSLGRHLGGVLSAQQAPAGMQTVARLPERLADARVVEAAAAANISTLGLSACHVGPPRHNGLILGYSGFPPARLDQAARLLARVVERLGPW
ncbi:MocR-like pyridoxine biosynthesis transcription factor PdxR [Arenibaculum pallidiluteum]|uniref:MocR-like pyridoxine biosynthesis transcription factor PdxR n=1 Tax=Arenibaculum pallidiluteum TaxID=2812559 RepID=UPI001A95A5F6|nr:PLP-dependent aminotransferase family protein [Arenibaculum pallidiluteum]